MLCTSKQCSLFVYHICNNNVSVECEIIFSGNVVTLPSAEHLMEKRRCEASVVLSFFTIFYSPSLQGACLRFSFLLLTWKTNKYAKRRKENFLHVSGVKNIASNLLQLFIVWLVLDNEQLRSTSANIDFTKRQFCLAKLAYLRFTVLKMSIEVMFFSLQMLTCYGESASNNKI